jgi:hypothetical protein
MTCFRYLSPLGSLSWMRYQHGDWKEPELTAQVSRLTETLTAHLRSLPKCHEASQS